MSYFLSPDTQIWLNTNTHRYKGGIATIIKTLKYSRWGYLVERQSDKKQFWVQPGECKEIPKENFIYNWSEIKQVSNVTSSPQNASIRFKGASFRS